MSKKPYLTTLLLIVSSAYGYGQKKNFDIINYTPLPGWHVTEQKEMVAMEKIDPVTNTFCQIIMYISQPSSGDAGNDFSKEWKTIAEFNTVPDAAPALSFQDKSSATGSAFVTHKISHLHYLSTLSVMLSGKAELPVLITTSTEESLRAFLPEIESFYKSIEWVAQGIPSGSPPATDNAPAPAGFEEVTKDAVLGKWGSSSTNGETFHKFEFYSDGTWKLAFREPSRDVFGYYDTNDGGTFQLAEGYLLLKTKDDTFTPKYRYRAWFEKSNGATSLCMVQDFFFDRLDGPSTRDYKGCYTRSGK